MSRAAPADCLRPRRQFVYDQPAMRSLYRIIAVGFGSILAVVLLALLALPFVTNTGAIRRRVATAASETLQHPVTLQGLGLRAIPRPGVQLTGLRIAERDGSPLLSVPRLVVEVRVAPLFRREIQVDRLVVAEPTVTLTRAADGSLNLPLPPVSAAPTGSGAPATHGRPVAPVTLDEARIENADVTIRDHGRPDGPPLARALGLTVVLRGVSLGSPSAPPGSSAALPLQRLTTRGTVGVREGLYETYRVENLTAALTVKGGVVRLDDLTLGLFGGTAAGTVVAKPAGATLEYETNLKLDALQMDRLYEAMGLVPGLVTGTLRSEEATTARGTAADELKRSLSGTVRFEIRDGAVRRMAAVGKIVALLDMNRILTGQPPDTARHGVPFTRLAGTLRIRNGLATTDDLRFQSAVLDATVKGTVNLVDQEVRMVVSVLGTEIDVQGPASNPTVSSRALEGLGGGGGLLEKARRLLRQRRGSG